MKKWRWYWSPDEKSLFWIHRRSKGWAIFGLRENDKGEPVLRDRVNEHGIAVCSLFDQDELSIDTQKEILRRFADVMMEYLSLRTLVDMSSGDDEEKK